jgi:hypothetical protein
MMDSWITAFGVFSLDSGASERFRVDFRSADDPGDRHETTILGQFSEYKRWKTMNQTLPQLRIWHNSLR